MPRNGRTKGSGIVPLTTCTGVTRPHGTIKSDTGVYNTRSSCMRPWNCFDKLTKNRMLVCDKIPWTHVNFARTFIYRIKINTEFFSSHIR